MNQVFMVIPCLKKVKLKRQIKNFLNSSSREMTKLKLSFAKSLKKTKMRKKLTPFTVRWLNLVEMMLHLWVYIMEELKTNLKPISLKIWTQAIMLLPNHSRKLKNVLKRCRQQISARYLQVFLPMKMKKCEIQKNKKTKGELLYCSFPFLYHFDLTFLKTCIILQYDKLWSTFIGG